MVNTCFNQGLTTVINDALDAVLPETNSRGSERVVIIDVSHFCTCTRFALGASALAVRISKTAVISKALLEKKPRTLTLYGVKFEQWQCSHLQAQLQVSALKSPHMWTIKCPHVCTETSALQTSSDFSSDMGVLVFTSDEVIVVLGICQSGLLTDGCV